MSEVFFIRGVEVIDSILATTDYDQVFFILVRHNWWLLYILLAIHFTPSRKLMVVSSVRGCKKELLPKVGFMQRNFKIWHEVNVKDAP